MLNELQDALETIYGIGVPHRVEDFVIDRSHLARLGQTERAPETLYVHEQDGDVDIGLYISPEVMRTLPNLGRRGHELLGVGRGVLPAFTTAIEGVSHFVYLTLQALRERAVSMLELEVQAEIDKFATAVLHLWKQGERQGSGELRARLFDRVSYRADLAPDERNRYVTANRLARGYAAFLEARFIATGQLEGLLRDLRRTYRLASDDKFAWLAAQRA